MSNHTDGSDDVHCLQQRIAELEETCWVLRVQNKLAVANRQAREEEVTHETDRKDSMAEYERQLAAREDDNLQLQRDLDEIKVHLEKNRAEQKEEREGLLEKLNLAIAETCTMRANFRARMFAAQQREKQERDLWIEERSRLEKKLSDLQESRILQTGRHYSYTL